MEITTITVNTTLFELRQFIDEVVESECVTEMVFQINGPQHSEVFRCTWLPNTGSILYFDDKMNEKEMRYPSSSSLVGFLSERIY